MADPIQSRAETEAAKICKDYNLPESACKDLVRCIRDGQLRECFNVAVAAAATAGCAALPGGTYYANLCGGIARWLASKVGTVGYITTPGCQLAPRRYVAVPEPVVEVVQKTIGGKKIQHWNIRWRSAGDYNTLIAQLNPGEFAQVWSSPHPTDNGGQSRVSITPMYYVGCSEEQLEAGVEPTYGIDEIQKRMNGGYGSAALGRAAQSRWASPNILAARDWQGTIYTVSNYKAPYWFSPALKIDVDPPTDSFKLIPTVPLQIAIKLPNAADYPAGSVAIYDSSIAKYRIIAPA